MDKIRTAILGYGRSGSTMHAGAIEKNDAFEMVAVCDIDAARRDEAHQRFGCPAYDNYHEMLEKEDLDLVCVITRSAQHCQMTCDCLDAGVDVLVTKPWAVDAGEAKQMMAAAERSGRRLLPWLPSRWGSDFRRLRELLDEGVAGNVFLVRRAVSMFATRSDWQMESQHGGGYLLNWGPHIVDPPVLLMGGRVTSVYAWMKLTINPGDTEDVFFALLKLAGGAVVQVEHTVSVEPLPNWFIQGDRGTIVVHGTHIKVCKQTPAQPTDPTKCKTMASQEEEVFEEDVADTVYGDEVAIYGEIGHALLTGEPFAVSPVDAFEVTKLLDAIRTSSKENRVVQL